MPSEQSDESVNAIANWIGMNFDIPWINYVGKFGIDLATESRLLEIYRGTGSPARFKDIDLARLNLRRALCQLRRLEVVQATLDDPPKRRHRNTDLMVICGYLGQPIFPILVKNYEAQETKDDQKNLILQCIAQILIWDQSASRLIADQLSNWLAGFSMQNRLLNGLLIEVAKLIQAPPKDLADMIERSSRLTLYFDDQQRLLGPKQPVTLFFE